MAAIPGRPYTNRHDHWLSEITILSSVRRHPEGMRILRSRVLLTVILFGSRLKCREGCPVPCGMRLRRRDGVRPVTGGGAPPQARYRVANAPR
jgi:hypothetical protein